MKKKEYQKRKDENLARWCERIAAMCCGRSLNDVLEMVSEVSKTSYIEVFMLKENLMQNYSAM